MTRQLRVVIVLACFALPITTSTDLTGSQTTPAAHRSRTVRRRVAPGMDGRAAAGRDDGPNH